MSTYMYAWTISATSFIESDGEILTKVGVTDNLQARKNQTEQPWPLELLAVIKFGREKKTLYENRFKDCHAHRRVDYGGGKEFFKFPSREYVVDMFKSIAIPEGVEFHPRDEFDAHWRHTGHVDDVVSEVEVVAVVAPPSTPAPPPSSLKRKRTHELSFDDAVIYKKACVKDPQFYEKFLDFYGESPFPANRYATATNSAISGGGITFVGEAGGVPLNKPPSYGENDILRDNPLDISDKASLLLWRRELQKVKDNRALNKNITTGNGNLSALIGKCLQIHANMSRAAPQSSAPKTGDKLVREIISGDEVNAALQSLHTSTICPLNIPKTCRELMRAVKEDASGTFDNLFESIGSGVKPNATIADVHDAVATACKYILKHIGKSTSLDSLVWNATWYGFPDLLENVHKHFPDFDLMQVLPHMDKYDAQSYQWIKEKFPDCLPPVESDSGVYWPIRS